MINYFDVIFGTFVFVCPASCNVKNLWIEIYETRKNVISIKNFFFMLVVIMIFIWTVINESWKFKCSSKDFEKGTSLLADYI